MKYFLFLLLFLGAHAAAQDLDMENDTIQMKEVIVSKKGKKHKIKTLMLQGACYSPEPLRDAAEIVTLVEHLPAGRLESATFYMNGVYEGKSISKSEDASFGILIYTVNEDTMPGQKIAYDRKVLIVNKKTAGKITIDLSGLDVQSNEKLFIGLVKESGSAVNNDLFLDCLCNGHDKYMTLARTGEDKPWERRWVCAAIRVDVSVMPDR